jgi:hypothetical protein
MKPAQDILQSLRDFGWPIVAYAVMAPIATYVISSNRLREERMARLVLIGMVIAVIEVFFFVGTESGEFVEVAQIYPAWGAYVILLALIAITLLVKWAIRRSKESRTAISMTSPIDIDPMQRKRLAQSHIAVIVGWLAASAAAVIWLSKIANR